MLLIVAAKKFTLHNLPFKIAHSSFIYLGVNITIRFENLFQDNFAPLLTHTNDDLERWTLLHLSLVAIINYIKINSPYIFISLPVPTDFSSQYVFQKD